MAGILERFYERRAFYKNLRQNDPTAFAQKAQDKESGLGQQLGRNLEAGQSRMFTQMQGQARDEKGRFRAMTVEEKKRHEEQKTWAKQGFKQSTDLKYTMSNDINDLKRALVDVMNEQLKELKKLQFLGKNPLGLLGDLLGLGGARGAGRGRGRGAGRGPIGSPSRGERVGRDGRTSAQRARDIRRSRAPGIRSGADYDRGLRIRGTIGRAAQRGTEYVAEAGGKITNALGKGKAALGRIRGGVASSFDSFTRNPMLGKALGSVATVGFAGYEGYKTLSNDKLTGGEKAQGVAKTAGGTVGSLALGSLGAQIGGTIGTVLLPGLGTVVGAAVGGIGGSIVGFLGGEKFIDKVSSGLSSAVESAGLGELIGTTAAVVMSPFSADARAALVNDYTTKIAPALGQVFLPLRDTLEVWGDKISDYATAFQNIGSQFLDGASEAGSALFGGLKTAVGQIKEGFASGGIRGALGAGGAAMRSFAEGGREARSKIDDRFLQASAELGSVSTKYETGGRGVGTVSTGKGDHGGVSYGKYQLATNNGSMDKFLSSAEGKKYATQFAGLKTGSTEFNQKYKDIAASDRDGLNAAQQSYIQRTHYAPAAQKLQNEIGLDVSKRGRAVQEAVFSTSVQYGANSGVIASALKGVDTSKMTDAQLVERLQQYKAQTVGQYFKSSSPEVQQSILNRAVNENKDLQAIAGSAVNNVAYGAGDTVLPPLVGSKNGPVTAQVAGPVVDRAGKPVDAEMQAAVAAAQATAAKTATPDRGDQKVVMRRGKPVNAQTQVATAAPAVTPLLPSTTPVTSTGRVTTAVDMASVMGPVTPAAFSVASAGPQFPTDIPDTIRMAAPVVKPRPADAGADSNPYRLAAYTPSASFGVLKPDYQSVPPMGPGAEPLAQMAMASRTSRAPIRAGGSDLPAEVQEVRSVNVQPEQKPTPPPTQIAQGSSRNSGSVPTLNDVPILFPDISLAPQLLGHMG